MSVSGPEFVTFTLGLALSATVGAWGFFHYNRLHALHARVQRVRPRTHPRTRSDAAARAWRNASRTFPGRALARLVERRARKRDGARVAPERS